ncbi:hypothetical protein TNCV_979091 [Trichonephila clavipes]|nr:hypothetical protein TNCV_979091 [Trichonephila clavipes]
MPRKRKSNLSQSSNIARTKKVARFNETFPQAELRRLEQAEREVTHRALRLQRSPKLGADIHLGMPCFPTTRAHAFLNRKICMFMLNEKNRLT